MRRYARQALRRALPVFGAVVFAYGAYPYVTLFRLGVAIRQGDSAALESLVDWDGVREGLKEDVCDAMAEEPDPATESKAVATRDETVLPAFGSGFMRGIAGNVIDRNVTPRAIVAAAARSEERGGAPGGASGGGAQDQPQIEWAFFDSPTSFMVLLRLPGKNTDPVRLQMELRHGDWKVTRAWLPRAMLMRTNERT
jgi:hypothetical protein